MQERNTKLLREDAIKPATLRFQAVVDGLTLGHVHLVHLSNRERLDGTGSVGVERARWAGWRSVLFWWRVGMHGVRAAKAKHKSALSFTTDR